MCKQTEIAMKEILLQYFSVKLDENGKELEKPKTCNGDEDYCLKICDGSCEATDYFTIYENAQTVIKLPTLSEFCKKMVFTYSQFGYNTTCYINLLESNVWHGLENTMLIVKTENIYNTLQNCHNCTIEQALNAGVTLYINPDKI